MGFCLVQKTYEFIPKDTKLMDVLDKCKSINMKGKN